MNYHLSGLLCTNDVYVNVIYIKTDIGPSAVFWTNTVTTSQIRSLSLSRKPSRSNEGKKRLRNSVSTWSSASEQQLLRAYHFNMKDHWAPYGISFEKGGL